MKKITLTLLGLTILLHFSFAQTNTFPASGSVGIGTTSPASNLQIGTLTPTSTATPLTLSLGGTYSNTAGANLKLKLYDDGTSLFGFGISASQLDAIIPTGGNFAWYVGGSQKLILNGAGNVGIGTSTPGSLLSLGGSVANRKLALYESGNVLYGLGIQNGTMVQYIANDLSTNHFSWGTMSADGSFNFSESMRLTAAGNVSIGTTDSKGYKFAVNGSVIAVSVNIKPNANWPDYVFKPTYKLPSLADVKTYIDKNRHLPEMPSAADIAKYGINVGQMNTSLTKKVEELTLYLIEKDKTEKGLQEQIDQLKKQMELLIKTKTN